MAVNLYLKKTGSYRHKHQLTATDSEGAVRYIVKAEGKSCGYPKLHLYLSDGTEIGSVYLSSNDGAGSYTLELNGKPLGALHRRQNIIRMKFNPDFADWKLWDDFLQQHFTVTDPMKNVLISIHKELTGPYAYTVEYRDPQQEQLAMLLTMMVDLAADIDLLDNISDTALIDL